MTAVQGPLPRPSGPVERMSIGLVRQAASWSNRQLIDGREAGGFTAAPMATIFTRGSRLFAIVDYDDGRSLQIALDLWLPPRVA